MTIIRASWAGTTLFTVVAVAAAAFPSALQVAAAAVDLVLFTIGLGAFGWAFLRAAGRSRTEELSVAGVWLLSGSAPADVRRSLLGSFTAQVVVALATAAIRPFTPLAFGILVPVHGLALCGVWGAAHGSFPPRAERRGGAAG